MKKFDTRLRLNWKMDKKMNTEPNTTWVQIQKAVPPKHTPPGITVADLMAIGVPQQN